MNGKKIKGFTMAEMMITVAILAVLAGLVFVGVVRYLKSMTQLEMDAIAKEIFISAQNHLSTAESQGFPNIDKEKYGTEDPDQQGVYYYVYPGNSNPYTADNSSLLDLMLPFGSIDETIRAGGSYVIRYQKSPAIVLDVFYASRSGGSFFRGYPLINGFMIANEDEYCELRDEYGGTNKKEARRNYNGSVIGWYGDINRDIPVGPELKAPEIEVINADTLNVEITVKDSLPSDDSVTLQLIIIGQSSKAKKAFTLTDHVDNKYPFVLDDITAAGKHFGQIVADSGQFIIGEDISVQAKIFSRSVLTNVVSSDIKIANSLFDNSTKVAEDRETEAVISNIRHLENLSKYISGCNPDQNTRSVNVKTAIQTENLSWNAFFDKGIVPYNGTTDGTKVDGHFRAVTPARLLAYDGAYHFIKGMTINEPDDAGLFATMLTGSSVKNLELIDFSVEGNTCAGALAGKLTGTVVTNVIARNTGVDDSTKSAVNVKTTDDSGSAGGLIGIQSGGSVNYSAAALIINGNTAGGLIGTVSDGASITGCYSAGHTKKGSYELWIEGDGGSLPAHQYDVEGATAGGLVGNAGSTNISYSYSTCSVKASSRGGGFAALTTGKITNCYCTGRVWPDFVKDQNNNNKQVLIHNAFRTQLEEGGLAAESSGYYYKIINEVLDADTNQIEYKEPYRLPGSNTTPAIKALDESADSYNEFVGSASKWKDARPYDNAALGKYYNGKYNLQTVLQLAGSNAPAGSENYFIKDHYGDWPAPEIFIINN